MVFKILIGIAVGMIIWIVGYNTGYKDGEREMYEFIRRMCPEETKAIMKRMETIYEELKEEYERRDGE